MDLENDTGGLAGAALADHTLADLASLEGIVGSIILPVLGAVPDGAIVLFSGLGPDAQEQLNIGIVFHRKIYHKILNFTNSRASRVNAAHA